MSPYFQCDYFRVAQALSIQSERRLVTLRREDENEGVGLDEAQYEEDEDDSASAKEKGTRRQRSSNALVVAGRLGKVRARPVARPLPGWSDPSRHSPPPRVILMMRKATLRGRGSLNTSTQRRLVAGRFWSRLARRMSWASSAQFAQGSAPRSGASGFRCAWFSSRPPSSRSSHTTQLSSRRPTSQWGTC